MLTSVGSGYETTDSGRHYIWGRGAKRIFFKFALVNDACTLNRVVCRMTLPVLIRPSIVSFFEQRCQLIRVPLPQ